jgi:hypothetical protein
LFFFILKEKFEFEIQKTPNFEFMSGRIHQILAKLVAFVNPGSIQHTRFFGFGWPGWGSAVGLPCGAARLRYVLFVIFSTYMIFILKFVFIFVLHDEMKKTRSHLQMF